MGYLSGYGLYFRCFFVANWLDMSALNNLQNLQSSDVQKNAMG